MLHWLNVIWHWEDISGPPAFFFFLPFFSVLLMWLVFTRAFFLPSLVGLLVWKAFTVYECHLVRTHEKNVAYLFFFISFHVFGFQQEHLNTKQFRNGIKLLTMVGSFAASPHTCSLFFRSFSISSIFFFLQPSCKQSKKHLDQNESPWKDACFEAARQQVALSLDRWEGSNAG